MLWKVFARMPSTDPDNPDFADVCYRGKFIAIGWGGSGDLARIGSWDGVKDALREMRYDATERTLGNHAGSIWSFLHDLKRGHLVVCPDREGDADVWYVGEVRSARPYFVSKPEDGCWFEHRREVRWHDRLITHDDRVQIFGRPHPGGRQTCARIKSGERALRAWIGHPSKAASKHGRAPRDTRPDREWGKEVERRAAAWIEENWGSAPQDVSHKMLGWDLEHGKWKIEVKGRKSRNTAIRLSYREWKAAETHGRNYMLMVFTAATAALLRRAHPRRTPNPAELLQWEPHPEYWLIEE